MKPKLRQDSASESGQLSAVIDQHGHVVCASAGVERFLALKTGETNILKLARTGLRAGLRESVRKSAASGERVSSETFSVRRAGETLSVRLSVRPLTGLENGNRYFIVCFDDSAQSNDTDKSQTTDESQAQLRRVINNQLGLAGVVDRNGILIEVDDQSLRIAGLSRNDVIGKHFAECGWWTYDPAVSTKIRESMERAFAGEIIRFDVPLFARGNQRLMIDFMLAPVRNAAGEVEYLIPSGVDISERVRAENDNRATAIRLEAIFNTAVDGIITIDSKGTINSVNPAAVGIFAYSADEMIGQNVNMLMPEPYHSEHDDYIKAFLTTHVPKIIGTGREVRGRRKDGSVFPLDLAVSETRLVGKHRFVGIVRDITERKEAENALRQNELRLFMAMRAGGMAAWEWRPEASYWTDELFELIGVPKEKAPSTELLFQQVHPEDLPELRKAWQRSVDGLEAYEHEFRIKRSDGEIRWIVGVGQIVRDENGEVERIFGMNWDSTRDHLAADALRESERRAQEANVAKSEFLANMSHEIRTPMTAILGYADLLLDTEENPDKVAQLRTIKRNGAFLLDIINDILDLSKIEADKLEVEQERFAAHKVVRDVVSLMQVRADEKGVSFEVEFDGTIPARIENDSRRLKQILVNLIGNAIKFTEKGTVRLVVRLLLGNQSTIQFDVIDTGIGMTKQQLESLFQPFAQGDATVSRAYGGTGLGLAISRRLAVILGGDIKVKSSPGKGSTFSCTIATGDISQEELIQPNLAAITDSWNEDVPDQKLNCRVLVVDDRRDVRLLSRSFLTNAGAQVETADDGQEALELVVKSMKGELATIDLILLDMQMPRLDGYQTAAALRKLGFQNPIIALTADAMHGDMNRCLACGCNAYLSKPIDCSELIKKVGQFMQPEKL